jgi:hypothetical protein
LAKFKSLSGWRYIDSLVDLKTLADEKGVKKLRERYMRNHVKLPRCPSKRGSCLPPSIPASHQYEEHTRATDAAERSSWSRPSAPHYPSEHPGCCCNTHLSNATMHSGQSQHGQSINLTKLKQEQCTWQSRERMADNASMIRSGPFWGSSLPTNPTRGTSTPYCGSGRPNCRRSAALHSAFPERSSAEKWAGR